MREVQQLESGSLDELTAFVAVGDAGSFTKAAKSLGRDPSIVSRRVSQLENRLGVRLLSRTTRRIALTEVGAQYLRRVQAVLEELSIASVEASDWASSPRGVLRVSLPMTFGREWIAPHFAPFLAKHQQIRLDVSFSDQMVDLIGDGFDVAIRVGVVGDSTLTARRIASYRSILVAAPEYLSRHGQPQTPADLQRHTCLGFVSNPYWPDWALVSGSQRRIVRPNCRLVTDNSEALMMASQESAGIALLPEWLTGPSQSTGRLTRILPDWHADGDGGVYAILPPGRLVPTKTKVFVSYVANEIQSRWKSLAGVAKGGKYASRLSRR